MEAVTEKLFIFLFIYIFFFDTTHLKSLDTPNFIQKHTESGLQ